MIHQLNDEYVYNSSADRRGFADPLASNIMTDFSGGGIGWSDRDAQSVLVVADGLSSDMWAGLVQAVDARLLDVVPANAAASRLALTVDVDVVLVDCRARSAGLEALVMRLDALAHANNFAIIFVTGMQSLDVADSVVSAPSALIVCEPQEHDLVVALFSALRQRQLPNRLHDSGPHGEARRLQKLADDVHRLTHMLESFVRDGKPAFLGDGQKDGTGTTLLGSPSTSYSVQPPETSTPEDIAIKAEQVRAILRARRLRDQLLPGDLFADPAWDIMLDLMAAHLEGNSVSVSSLCIAAAVPPTTALRWIQQLTDRGLLLRRADQHDGRRIFITLSQRGLAAIRTWFDLSRPLLQSAMV
jgi:predicted transcriptional regulator